MAIEKKTISDISPGIRSVYHKAQDVIATNSLDYGIELLKEILKKEPGFLDARTALRSAERKRALGMSTFKKFIAKIKLNKYVIIGRACLSKNPRKALDEAEEALSLNVWSTSALSLLADAGRALGANFIVVEALESIVELDDKNESNLKALAEACEIEGEGNKVLRIRQQIASKHPNNLEAQAALRAAAALATMERTKKNEKEKALEKQKKFEAQAKGGEATSELLRDDRVIRSEDDVKKMVEYYEGLVKNGDESIDNRRKLADFYQRLGRWADAIEAYQWIVDKHGTLDPTLDKNIEECTVKMYAEYIAQLKEQKAPQEEIDQRTAEINQYRLERAEDRVKNYPNDTLVRYELAVIYWEFGQVEKALEQFQYAQKNPQKRLSAIVYLGRCFAAKKQYDMAVEQYEKAISEMPTMDAQKMDALYHQGCTYGAIGDDEKAMDCFKQIYAVNVNYLDVAKRMDAFYQKINAKRHTTGMA